MNYGFIRVGACVPSLKVADCTYNKNVIINQIKDASDMGIEILVFPELCITGYTCSDLFMQDTLLVKSQDALTEILNKTKDLDISIILGLPIQYASCLYNCAVVINKGKILGIIPKTYIPNYLEYYEMRWFESGSSLNGLEIDFAGQRVPFGTDILFKLNNDSRLCYGVEICEDLWSPLPPSTLQTINGAKIIFNLSASNEIIGKQEYRESLIMNQSARQICGYVYCSAGMNESTTDVVFGGYAAIAEYGSILCHNERFDDKSNLIYSEIDINKLNNDRIKNTSFKSIVPIKKEYRAVEYKQRIKNINKLTRYIDPYPFVPSSKADRNKRCEEIFSIQTAGLQKRLMHTRCRTVVIGISGGLDSTYALLVTVNAFDKLSIDRKNILAVTMPGFGTTDITYTNAMLLMKAMGVSILEINIKNACMQHFSDIGHDYRVHDVTYENVQARERTQILMDLANKNKGLVIGTGDLSELALGWCTYNGDHMSMYSVNCSVPKTLIKYLVEWVADTNTNKQVSKILYNVIDTPISPELLPPSEKGEIEQKTEDIVGPYELHDFFLYHFMRYGAKPKKIKYLAEIAFEDKYCKETIVKWLRIFLTRFFSQQFKRSCIPDGPKVGTISLSPRGDLRMPSDASVSIWLEELED